jgi:hypothetical protein
MQLNTEELNVNYHSVSTVFAVTRQNGATGSLKWASRWLQLRSDIDKRYYDTYLKYYQIKFIGVHDDLFLRLAGPCMNNFHPFHIHLDAMIL